ncbi:nickel-dependent hydrogenase large subunit [Methylocystis sp. Sn-Cys]|uniref:nickel-dependent hydrogenase large subunit n=1 Tax=Methylocystis sp. Sn-Cys TaxID=1701263 RepID=UPI001924B061|nr:nickel-dependent hydrogenase large subunit [Methylocystis sp. Sn-Cys]MBL1257165.1 nickel-dependent hydrogenase large subunit [Methylocystis sp. Sn-Cys]
MARVELNVSLNRVEGDLELAVTLDDGVVAEARTIGTMYRGFEQILIGRAPRDALVITPRVCGICGTAHLYSSALALERAWGAVPPPNATRIRNLCLMAEGIQNDLRQTFLFFTPDFCNPRYAAEPWFDEIMAAFEPFRGTIYLETLAVTRKVVQIVAHFGGQWPHSSYMAPGGVTLPADLRRISACRAVLDDAQRWYEQRIVGAPLERWLALDKAEDYFAWLDAPAHAASALGMLSRCVRALGLHRSAAGAKHMLSYGAWRDPSTTDADATLLASGFYDGETGTIAPLDQTQINEHVRHSWFRHYEGGRHPWNGETIPNYEPGGDRYTWSKAPRYGEKVVQTGPLAELLIGGDPLIASLNALEGGGAWLRQFARARRIAHEFLHARRMLDQLAADLAGEHFIPPANESDGDGYGLIMAARGALGHWIKIKDGVIEKYQIVTPTAWNASPRDSAGQPGHWEQSLVGVEVRDPDDPVEIGHIIRSHDPCLVCTVHMLDTGRKVHFNA